MANYVRSTRVDRAITSRVYNIELWRGFAGADPTMSVLLLIGLGPFYLLVYRSSAHPWSLLASATLALGLTWLGFRILRSAARYDKYIFADLVGNLEYRDVPLRAMYAPAYRALSLLGLFLETVRVIILLPLSYLWFTLRYTAVDLGRSIGVLVVVGLTLILGTWAFAGPFTWRVFIDALNGASSYGREICIAELAVIVAFSQVLASSIGQARQIIDSRLTASAGELKTSCLQLRDALVRDTVGNDQHRDFRRKQIKYVSKLLSLLIKDRTSLAGDRSVDFAVLSGQVRESIAVEYLHDEFFDEIDGYSRLLLLNQRLTTRARVGWAFLGLIAAFVAGLAILPKMPASCVLASIFLTLVVAASATRRQLDL